ncbi:MAG TPA: PQQ-dependent sugar dehydrogenase [Terriglobia bacterium]|nr:PQQ-dependent sugar dehydrogenase [Terriglobia bacterium]
MRMIWDRWSLVAVCSATLLLSVGGPAFVRGQNKGAAPAAAPAPQPAVPSLPNKPLPAGFATIDTAEQGRVRVHVMKGLSHPWSLAFLPNGDILVTERPGRLRIVRNRRLDPKPIAGIPAVYTDGSGGLMDIALHPRFAENGLVYLTHTKAVPGGRTSALIRGRLDGMRLTDVQELFVSNGVATGPAPGNGMVFGPDGYIYMAVGGANDEIAQNLTSHTGKILRFTDDGGIPTSNPFTARPGSAPEIFSYGHRNMLGLTVHPVTGEIWETENGPQGGDEVNILKAGANYGWPLVSYGRQYSGARVSNQTSQAGLEDPVLVWTPSIAISGLTFYTGTRFPAWRNNLFVGGLQFGRIAGTGQLQRIVFNENWEEIRREALLADWRQRIRNVRQGPDGLLYLLTDEDDGALLIMEPM